VSLFDDLMGNFSTHREGTLFRLKNKIIQDLALSFKDLKDYHSLKDLAFKFGIEFIFSFSIVIGFILILSILKNCVLLPITLIELIYSFSKLCFLMLVHSHSAPDTSRIERRPE
jgi:hypothetical protein